jgi:antitoxin component YwqK of YwqJK toxin-antitoxin module/tetratricopeptide (TPR) repeat protein
MIINTRGALLALLVAAPLLGRSQQQLTWPEKGQLVKEGIALHDKQDYAGAIAKYAAVTPGDTTYAWAQSEMAMTLSAAGKHEEAVAAAQRALAQSPFEPHTYNTLADAQEELKQVDAALATYQKALKLFPYNQSLYYNQGVTLLKQNQTAAALASLQRSLELNPVHPNTHRLLGLLAAQQGQPAHTLISWLTFLALSDPTETTRGVLVNAERLSLGVALMEDSERVKPVAPNSAFAELDQLLESKVALQKGYASKVKIDAAVVKQTQLLVEKFPVDGPADDFWVRTYGPMVAALRRDDHLTTFTYLILQTADDAKARQWVKANKAKVEKMLAVVLPPLMALRAQQPVAGGTPLPAWFSSKGAPEGLGPGSNTSGQFVGSGEWISLSNDGAIEATGRFSATGKQVGTWKFMRPDGLVTRTVPYNDQGEREGTVHEFHPNGQPSGDLQYHQNKVDGLLTMYNECGTRTDVRTFKAGDLEGPYNSYFPNGQLRYRATVHADKIEGLEERFYADGTPELTMTYVAGQKQGPFATYYPDKSLEKKGEYDQNERHGTFTEYFRNGAVSETGRFEHGKHVGPWRLYFASGKLSVEKTYDASGELHGLYHDYDEQGHLYSDTEYAHGRTIRLQYFDQAGKLILDQPVKKGRTAVRCLGPEGEQLAVGAFTDGQMSGEWKWFYRDGSVREITSFNNQGGKSGTSETYYVGGQLQRRLRYDAEGNEDGYYERFQADGQPAQSGYYQAGRRQGPWKDYYATGRVSEEYEYHLGEINGPARSYAPGGKLTQERLFEYSKMRRLTTYDSTGQVLSLVELKPDSKEYSLRYPNGKTLFRSGLTCYEYSGPATWLRPDGSTEISFQQLEGQRHGEYKSTHASGQPSQTGAFLAGQRNGEWTIYYPSGQLHKKGRYLGNDREGEWTEYFPNGKVEFVEQYQDGDRHGPSRRYNPAGELLVEKQYEHGELLRFRGPAGEASAPFQALAATGGPVKTSFANGKPAVDEAYRHSRLDGTVTYYYSTGEVFRRAHYAKGLLTGMVESYYPGGKLLEQEAYLHGEQHGRSRYFRPDGTLEREESYLSNERSGPTTYFDAAGKPLRTELYWNGFVHGQK